MEPQEASDNVPNVTSEAPAESTGEAPAESTGEAPAEAPAEGRGAALSAAGRRFVADQVAARPASFAVDVASLVAIAWTLWWFADNDGGLSLRDLRPFSVLLLVLAPALGRQWRRTPRAVRWLLVLLPLGALVSTAAGIDRSRFVADALAFGSVPVLVLAASRLSRRAWSRLAMFAIVGMAFLAWSWLAGLKWWGWSDLGMQPRWELVSWRNQSGILSAALAVWASGLVVAGRRSPSLVAGGAVALGLAGAWLSTSRAAIVFGTAGVLTVAVVVVLADDDRRRRAVSTVGRLAGVAATTVVVVGALQVMLPAGTSAPIESRGGETVTGNAITRTKHWEAALGMFVERPFTGTGMGSYRAIAARHNPPDGRLTSSAHSAWFEGFAEGGLVFGLPLLGLAAMLGLGILRLPGRLATVEDDEFGLGRAFVVGAAGAAATVVTHASIDFDLSYPTILAVAAVGGGVVLSLWTGQPSPTPDASPSPRRDLAVLALVPAVVLLLAGVIGAGADLRESGRLDELTPTEVAQVRPAWDTSGRRLATTYLLQIGEPEAAELAAEGAARWNPGDPTAWMNLARVRYVRGELSADGLLAQLELPPTVLAEWTRAAETLFEGGDHRQAEIAARQAISFHPEYAVWGITGTVMNAWRVVADIGILARGCDEGARVLAQAEAQGFDPRGDALRVLRTSITERCPALD